MEVQSRVPPSSAHLLASLHCFQHFNLLQHHFSTAAAEGELDVGLSLDVSSPRSSASPESLISNVRTSIPLFPQQRSHSLPPSRPASSTPKQSPSDIVSPFPFLNSISSFSGPAR
ncbi:hypothetical protein J5N97_005419 [Dioscorea zingiberensis]|uniref:Uncharacterized protein n=1 Tax=Dioscorea zingiberensis TaxID=325984 RepID=A0A9D5HS78_9LILI|nr:hypothetical protein J5N97_005419 [Dioscorea zingiberensis]